MTDDPLLTSLRAAVAAAPDDVPLRLHLAGLLAERDDAAGALAECSQVLQREPANAEAIALLNRVSAALSGEEKPKQETPFDWSAAEEQLGDIAQPAFVNDGEPVGLDEEVQAAGVRLDDVGGMDEVKQRLEIAFLGPMRNPELARTFRKSLSGGLMLYGPPGCGKTFIARAVAGEMGARFYPVGIAEVLDMYIGNSERAVKELFDVARRNAPCVLFFDELDALGQKRSHLRNNSWLRTLVNTLLTEMDSVSGRNEGVFVLAATNHPWDVDTALRRPGRFDRMLLVLPPDAPARAAILRYHLDGRPLAGIDVDKLVRATEDFSGADIAHACESAAELALADSVRTGKVRPVTMDDFRAALKQIKPSTGPWFAAARNVATFANTDGEYDDLLAYMKKRRMV
ncbi:ATP-binding protein [Fodinicola acaciae]|uniref:ATP-binding protein n=1 Tax=Fodinicola acaciae TaxID=2681555 RepID=UPI0013D08C46|nr:ATP-binding protein [Fodinicola acaciae]